MDSNRDETSGCRSDARLIRSLLVGTLAALALSACTLTDDLLTAPDDPNTVGADAPLTLQAALAGAESDFFFGWDVFVTWSGVFSDELFSADVSCQGNWDCRRVESDDDDTGRRGSGAEVRSRPVCTPYS